ncbi:hypothetical protein GGS24DRAFT_507913 [Hypoxylon argillaceum]|nr:hypothetical protein GGS24DRAFT_507913 [Hypoxylon argillaceum]
MEWIGRTKKFTSDGDLAEFKFIPDHPCTIQTIRLRRDSSGAIQVFENETLKSEPKYLHWINQSQSLPDEPTVTLVMHQRLDMADAQATSVPYGKDTFIKACNQLYQHRSIADAIRRKSPATFTCRTVAAWESQPDWGPAVVYNCKSDTISPAEPNGLVLSMTYFPKKSTIRAVAYGCTAESRDYIETWLQYAKAFAFNPLLLPMLWAELERQRFLDKVDHKASDLRKRILDMNNLLVDDGLPKKSLYPNDASNNDMIENMGGMTQKDITQRECTAVNLWVDVSALKNGLESFRSELKSMLENSRSPPEIDENVSGPPDGHPDPINKHSSDRIQSRLSEMIVEIEAKVRYMDSLLGGMTLAAQTESNHLSRCDELANSYIAVASKKDSSFVRDMALLGMIFLPSFATLFSMTFFNWTPQGSNQIVSPWVMTCFGFAAISTAGSIWHFRT